MDDPKVVEIDHVKNRLVELLKHDDCPLLWMQGDVNNLAAYLLANGVRLEEKQSIENNASDESKRQNAEEKVCQKALHFLAAILDVYRDEEKRELYAFDKLDLNDDITEDFTALLLAIHVVMQELTGFDGDLIDMTNALNKLAFQHLMESKTQLVEDEADKYCDNCGERSPATGWCEEKGIYTEPGGTCQSGGAG